MAKKALQSTSSVAVTIEAAAVPAEKSKPVAFYAMFDSSEQEDGDMDVEDVLREISRKRGTRTSNLNSRLYNNLSNMPGISKVSQNQSDQLNNSSICKLVNMRNSSNTIENILKMSNLVVRNYIHSRKHSSNEDSLDAASVAKGPSPRKSTTPELIPDESTGTGSSSGAAAHRSRFSQSLLPDAEYIDRGHEFLRLSPRKDSQTTSCTSSSGPFSFADATAIVPDPSAPLAEDEIWDEYNDLLGDETAKVPPSAGSSQGMPFYLDIQASEDSSPISQVNLRVGSMTVSKWLTFGHVLFSPARDDMIKAASPSNDHSYTSHADKFPFGPELFTTAVFRFLAAAPESHYKNIVDEARRVLKPGGYLELSILDLDLNNMGPRTRRAIRRLKEQVHGHAPNMHLGSAADAILRLLGAQGFTDIKTCRVGIPVANSIPPPRRGMVSPVVGQKPTKDQRSLAEMINDESPVADESITSTVARVGRWWHSRCYGDAALEPSLRQANNATKSSDMWMDRALLRECEEWRTSLKLMVCYARVPDIKREASI
ncbi:MAG: hypothetical protein STHCBS139747_002867 [Sporothrix thermara]